MTDNRDVSIGALTPSMNAFDTARASFRTIVVPCADVIDLLAVTHAPEHVAEFRDRMRAGVRFPPVAVVCLGGRYFLADGHKRFTAYRAFSESHILVEVWPFWRWLLDQARQVRDNGRKAGRILRMSVVDPGAAWRLALTTVRHWRRVATSLLRRATGRLP